MAGKGKAAPKKGAAALAESEEKSVTFRGVDIKLAPKLPATLLFDLTEIEIAGESPLAVLRLLRSLVGPEQFRLIRNRVESAEEDDGFEDVGSLVSNIFEQYGLTVGEASASDDS